MKPFKPPTLLNRPRGQQSSGLSEPPAKKQRISHDEDQDIDTESIKAAANLLRNTAPPRKSFAATRIPLDPLKNTNSSSQTENVPQSYFTVLWRKFTTKKNKTWDGDGVLSLSGSYATLQDVSGKELGRGVCKGPLMVGSELSIGGRNVEVESMISRDDYVSGRVFLGTVPKTQRSLSLREIDGTPRVTIKAQMRHDKIAQSQKDRQLPTVTAGRAANASFKTPLLNHTVQVPRTDVKTPMPRHDPKAEGALVMRRLRTAPKGKHLVDVVVDPLLSKSLREHQREGVAFLYECVMGMKDYGGEGAILADEMGLGKTLQVITLLWTLLKQNPVHEEPPVVKKALIVCPVTLINNWRKEIRKWLGNERIGVFVPENNKVRLTDFTKGRAYHVMIIGYERLVKVKDQLHGDCGIDLVIADEGHRLKTAKNKAAAAIKSINTDRRVILSGTPVQNDLEEFYQMLDFVNPNIISKYSTFKREFEVPINKSRQPGASMEDLEKGKARSEELNELTAKFLLRRTADVLAKYLPPKTEYVIFCKPTKVQATVYRTILRSQAFVAAMNSQAVVLELINVLKKVCNCPALLTQKGDKGNEGTKPEFLEDIPPYLLKERGASGKLQVLDSLLYQIKEQTQEKVVLISNYTSTMDILATLLTSMNYSYLRLDGSTPQGKRQDLVDRFNRSPQSNSFVFLLSAKAGGVGLNLIGASRLILFDLDWNPATDLQAMARIHRDGQKRPCFIYRLLTQGALDEKIFQRQVSKTGLADSIVDGKASASGFSQAELRDLFTLDESNICQTHQLLGCGCGGNGVRVDDSIDVAMDESEVGKEDPGGLNQEDGIEIVRLDEDYVTTVVKDGATLKAIAKRNAEEADIHQKLSRDTARRNKMLSLMQYTHFDTARVDEKIACDAEGDCEDESADADTSELDLVDTAVEDFALRNVVREPGRRIGFVLTKLSS